MKIYIIFRQIARAFRTDMIVICYFHAVLSDFSPLFRDRTMSETQPAGNLRLTIELVPETCWYSNMRKVLSRAQWDKLRKQVYADYNHRCGICGAAGKLECHEIWRYDDEQHIQSLQGFIALCEWCHHVKHIGLSGLLAGQGKLDYDKVIAHFMQVNGCDGETFEQHRKEAFAQWRERSKHEWVTELGEYKP